MVVENVHFCVFTVATPNLKYQFINLSILSVNISTTTCPSSSGVLATDPISNFMGNMTLYAWLNVMPAKVGFTRCVEKCQKKPSKQQITPGTVVLASHMAGPDHSYYPVKRTELGQ